MNIVYAIKIFAALSVVAFVTKLVAGAGLRAVLAPKDLKHVWWGIVGTLAVSCFSVRVEFVFITLPIWALVLSNLIGEEGSGRLPAYGLLCCICPPMYFSVQHIGPLNDLILLTPFRILALFLLLPEAVRLATRRQVPKRPGWLTLCDATTLLYSAFWLAGHFAALTMSTIAREFSGQLLDSLLPYYVLTRACVQLEVRQRFLAFVLAGAVYQAFVGMAESLSGHYLYSQLQWLYNGSFAQATGLMRGTWLRAVAAFPGPLAMAMLMLFGSGIWFALKKPEKDRRYLVCLLALLGGLLATYGRGPILATLVLFASLAVLRRISVRRYLAISVVAVGALSIGWKFGIGQFLTDAISSLSAGDATADFNVRYRQELLDTALGLLQQSPWLGVPNYLAQMQDLRQGEGIIDLVNTYLVVALNSGLLGIVLVFTPYAVTLWRAARAVPPDAASASEHLPWVALTVAVMVAIFTVSPISIIQPIMVWVIAMPLARLQQTQGVASGRIVHTKPSDFAPPLYADTWR